ncbi:SPOR domain-containing protein [Pseudoalteromonas sp. R3]|uniref:SPOR domain-containing protein n=1 Tax=Pseudoalteromonas sp. R3 TaxID=1709477 RepID=UPI0006B40CB0|nr:SPOR domain-containing protein [Pseudoalteromonas sp. R3]AZZ97479.1 SPOR domain-containing protein [Pseudoalteromonas sp. R3]
MNSGFINRLVGTSIVVIAAVVFIPNILDGEKVHYKEGFKPIPERPEFSTIELKTRIDERASLATEPMEEVVEDISADDGQLSTELITNELQDDTQGQQQTDTAEVEVASNKGEEKPEPTQTSTDLPAKSSTAPEVKSESLTRPESSNFTQMAYVIQLGSFSHKSNVEALTKKLTENGFKTFTRPVKTPNGTLTKVFVGPDLNKAKLEAKLPELKKLTKLNGRLTQFTVVK